MKDITKVQKRKIREKLARENKTIIELCNEIGCSRNAYYLALTRADRATNVSIAILNWLNTKEHKKGVE